VLLADVQRRLLGVPGVDVGGDLPGHLHAVLLFELADVPPGLLVVVLVLAVLDPVVDLAVGAAFPAAQVERLPHDVDGFLAVGVVPGQRLAPEITERTDVIREDGDLVGHVMGT